MNRTLGGGRYTASIRVDHDDGVRFIVDGQTWIDTWGQPRGDTITATRDLSPGPHTLIIEYNDNTHYAFLYFELKREGPGSAPAPSTGPAVVQPPRPVATPFIDVITYGQGRVTTGRLNVRPFPDTRDAPRLGVTTYGRYHPIVGRNVDGSWYQIVSNGRLGWVFARYLELDATALNAEIPITNQSALALRPETGYLLIAKGRVSIRAYPSEGDALLGTLPDNAEAAVVGRTGRMGLVADSVRRHAGLGRCRFGAHRYPTAAQGCAHHRRLERTNLETHRCPALIGGAAALKTRDLPLPGTCAILALPWLFASWVSATPISQPYV